MASWRGAAGLGLLRAAVAAGHGVDVVDAATSGALATADFAAYAALILGDPNCVTGTGASAVAEANTAV